MLIDLEKRKKDVESLLIKKKYEPPALLKLDEKDMRGAKTSLINENTNGLVASGS